MAAVWGRAWRSRVSSTKRGGDTGDDDGGGSLHPTGGHSITSGTTYSTTTGTTCTTTTSVGERSLDFHPFVILPTARVGEEIITEQRPKELEEEWAKIVFQKKEWAKKLEYLKGLVVQFRRDNNSAPERWLSELEVSWVLHLAHVSESGRTFISRQLLYLARSWTLALFEITKSVVSICVGGWCSNGEANVGPSASEFTRFVEATLSKMLPFVDAIVAVRVRGLNDDGRGTQEPPDEKLQALIDVRDALSTAAEEILSSFRSLPCCVDHTKEMSISTAAEGILSSFRSSPCCVDHTEEMRELLSAELLGKLDKAIRETWTVVMSSSWFTNVSPDIHPATRSVFSNIKVLWANYGPVNRILHDAFLRGEFVPENENMSHLSNLTIGMVLSLEERLARMSQTFPDESLKLLFLVNNVHFILQQLRSICPLNFPIPELAGKIDDYISSYIQVSWAPLLKFLHNPTPRCFMRRHSSPLLKFESKFQTTYSAQNLWKVPDPAMKKRLRKAIVEEVISVFTEFLKDNSISTPRVTPQEMKKMLEELFEG